MLVFFLIAGVSYIVNRPSVTFGAVASLPSSATQNTERATVNDLLNLTANFSTTTTNTFTNAQTFSAGWVISATSTGTNGIAITGGCFSLNGACLSSGGGASTTLLSDANTWSNAGTTTYSGNVSIVGNLKVAGNVFAPVTLVSSGNAQINGTLLVTGQTTLATTLTGSVSAASGVLSAGTLSIANGGTGIGSVGASSTVATTNGSAVAWQKLDLVAAVYGILPMANGGTATTSLSSAFNNGNSVMQPSVTLFATTTSFLGTLSTKLQTKTPLAEVFNLVNCEARNGSGSGTFIAVVLGYGTASTTSFTASTTVGTIPLSFAVPAGSNVFIDISTTTSITTGTGWITNCTFKLTV